MRPIGYIVMQHGLRDTRPVLAYKRWMDLIPGIYREAVLDETPSHGVPVDTDPYCLALLKHYRSLKPMAMTARKPMFFLKSADGAIGAHGEAVRSCYRDFERLAAVITARAGIPFA
jgi:chromosome partitioning protein